MNKMIKKFKHGCTCGGYAWRMNGRDPIQLGVLNIKNTPSGMPL
jgi:hypothetical protein